jgi:hypothetical protein
MTGDYNGDWQVDTQDYNAWRTAFGTTAAAADGNRNGVVEAADFVIWRKALSSPGAASSAAFGPAAIPEPRSLALGVLGATSATLLRRGIWR